MNNYRYLKKLAIIPVYNNADGMIKVLAKFRENFVDEICIVVDCATQYYIELINKLTTKTGIPAHIIKNEDRKGVGFAIRQGIEYALHKGFDIVVVMAGNNKDNPSEIPKLLAPVLDGDYDYVQGSRFLPGGACVKNPFLRGVFSRLYPFLWTLLTRVPCTDVTNGFRAYKLKIVLDKRINLWQEWLDSYELEYYLHYKVLTLGYRVKEIPVSKTYPFKHRGGYSNISPLRDWWKIVGPLVYLKLGIRN
jgi:dolichol-phosphate mannosyltransferase